MSNFLIVYPTELLCYVPATEEDGGHIAFGADPVGVRIAALHLLNQWVDLTKLAQTHYWEGGKKWLDFGDTDLIFKITPALWNFKILTKKACLLPISWTKWRILAKLYILQRWDGLQISLDFCDRDLIFKVTTL